MVVSEALKKEFKKQPYVSKTDVYGRVVTVLRICNEDWDLPLIPLHSRCVCKYDVHELCTTDEQDAAPGYCGHRAAYLGFMEIEEGGVILAGDEVYYNDKLIGHVAGFNDGHMPNHYNIIIRSDELISGEGRGMELNGKVVFHKP